MSWSSIFTTLGMLLLASTFVLVWHWKSTSRTRKALKRPPGPPHRFIIGNLLDVPIKEYHIGYAQLAKKYGPILQLTLPTQTIVVLSSAKTATDLLEKRGAIYSDRPPFHMMDLMGWDWILVLQRHGNTWRMRRKVLHTHLHIRANVKFEGLLTRTALIFARRLLESPDLFINHLRWTAAANILEAAYGIEISLEGDPLVETAQAAMQSVEKVLIPGKYAVDSFPALKHIPKWFPGAKFKRDAEEWSKLADAARNVPFSRALQELERGTARHSVVADALRLRDDDEWKVAVKDAVGIMYIAGADTTVSILKSFFLTMVQYPDIQHKAQDEIERVVGKNRLPTLSDRPSLQYVEALMREIYRMYPVVPMGLPHAAEADDVYEGMFISKGTVVLANVWAILHDPVVYPDPDVFNPERFLQDGLLNDTVADPREAIFGFGRRICPGQHFADDSIYIVVVTVLSCFNLACIVKNGIEVVPSGEFDHQFLSAPRPFECAIVPRSAQVQGLINQGLNFTS